MCINNKNNYILFDFFMIIKIKFFIKNIEIFLDDIFIF